MQRQGKLLNAAMRSQEATNEKTYENVMRTTLDYQRPDYQSYADDDLATLYWRNMKNLATVQHL